MKSLRLLAAFALAAPGAAPAVQPSQAAPNEREAELAAAAAYFLPALAADSMIDGVDTAIRQRVATDPQLTALESRYPGIGAAMVAGASSEVREAAPALLAEVEARIRAGLAERLSDTQLRSLSAYLALPSVQALLRGRVVIRPGETVSAAIARHIGDAEEDRVPRAEREAMRRFERSEEGRRIFAILDRYQAEARALGGDAATAAGTRSLRAALRAGNAFAAERYPRLPRPFAID